LVGGEDKLLLAVSPCGMNQVIMKKAAQHLSTQGLHCNQHHIFGTKNKYNACMVPILQKGIWDQYRASTAHKH
jgi:hypothetical protein